MLPIKTSLNLREILMRPLLHYLALITLLSFHPLKACHHPDDTREIHRARAAKEDAEYQSTITFLERYTPSVANIFLLKRISDKYPSHRSPIEINELIASALIKSPSYFENAYTHARNRCYRILLGYTWMPIFHEKGIHGRRSDADFLASVLSILETIRNCGEYEFSKNSRNPTSFNSVDIMHDLQNEPGKLILSSYRLKRNLKIILPASISKPQDSYAPHSA